MELGLAGRAALITGGSRGIGRAVAMALAAEGARVAICARGREDLAATAAAIEAAGGQVLAVPADVTRPEDIENLVAQVAAAFGRLDILVNNAVSSTQGTFFHLSDEDWRHHLEVKLMGYVRCARAALPHMQRQGWGRIVNVAGLSARDVTAYRITNGAVNAAVTNFTKHLAQQVAPYGITVNAVHPGPTWTPRLQQRLQREAELEHIPLEAAVQRARAAVPIGRFVEPADVAHLVVFLCSDGAAAITGQAVAVDGGAGQSIAY